MDKGNKERVSDDQFLSEMIPVAGGIIALDSYISKEPNSIADFLNHKQYFGLVGYTLYQIVCMAALEWNILSTMEQTLEYLVKNYS